MMTLSEFMSEWNSPADRLLVHTSGSTGTPKPLWVEKRRMEASARTTCRFLGLRPGDTALLCMPLDYIAGKMMVVRAMTCGLRLIAVPPTGHPLATVDDDVAFAAMVPMQVYNSLRVPEERRRLMAVRHLIIGGGAVSGSMEAELRTFPGAVWSTYGMTETLSHVALRRISGSGADGWYTPFDGVDVGVNAEGCLVIDAPDVCATRLVTNDIAEIAPDGRRFRIIGRRDNVICSGGVKLQIEEIEAALRPLLPHDFIITKRPDSKFGEAVVLLTTDTDTEGVMPQCAEALPPYWRPKLVAHVSAVPLTPTGKPARAEAMRMASEL